MPIYYVAKYTEQCLTLDFRLLNGTPAHQLLLPGGTSIPILVFLHLFVLGSVANMGQVDGRTDRV